MTHERVLPLQIDENAAPEQYFPQVDGVLPREKQYQPRIHGRGREQEPRRRVETGTWYGQLINDLNVLVSSKKPLLDGSTVLLSRQDVVELLDRCRRPREHKSNLRLRKLSEHYLGSEATVRWLGGKLRILPNLEGRRNPEIETLARRVLPAIRHSGEYIPHTPESWYPEKPMPHEILSTNLLESAFENILLSSPDSFANKLRDPIAFSIDGIAIKTRTGNEEEEINYGFTISTQLLEILHTLRHQESLPVLRDWLLGKCFIGKDKEKPNLTGAEGVMIFLQTLVNFTSFLDSKTHLELYEPPKIPGRDGEFFIHPFHVLKQCLGDVAHQLYPHFKNTPLHNQYRELVTSMELRYGEVYSGAKQRSLFTADESALIPAPKDFAKLAVRIAEERTDYERTAKGLIKLAESVGLEDIKPLLELLGNKPELKKAVIREATLAGFIEDAGILREVLNELVEIPWKDIINVRWEEIVDPETTDIVFDILTGTFGPLTSGHVDAIQRELENINSAARQEGNKVYQRFLLIMPIINPSNIASYEKDIAQVGTIIERVHSIILQLALTKIDRKQVFIVTTSQSNPGRHRDTQEGARDARNRIVGQMTDSLSDADRSAGFDHAVRFVVGPDELTWTDSPRKLASRELQRSKVLTPGGVVIVRRGWLLAILRNSKELGKYTGIDTVILTPGTPYTSSSAEIDNIKRTGKSRAARAAARWYLEKHWNNTAIENRNNLPELEYIPTLDQIVKLLIEEIKDEIGN